MSKKTQAGVQHLLYRMIPRRMPTTTLMASFDRRRPTAVIGGAWSQSPACVDCTARNRARDTASITFEVSDVSAAMIIPESQFRCLAASCPVGAKVADDAVHTSKLAGNDGSGEATDPDPDLLLLLLIRLSNVLITDLLGSTVSVACSKDGK